MKEPIIDETKLQEVMEIIDEAVSLMEVKNCETDKEAKHELEVLQNRLWKITGNNENDITSFRRYSSVTNLETVARGALISPPEKENVTNAQIKDIVLNILKHDEPEMHYWLKYLILNTGLTNLTDYIFYPHTIGLDKNASLEQIADKIIADRQ